MNPAFLSVLQKDIYTFKYLSKTAVLRLGSGLDLAEGWAQGPESASRH